MPKTHDTVREIRGSANYNYAMIPMVYTAVDLNLLSVDLGMDGVGMTTYSEQELGTGSTAARLACRTTYIRIISTARPR